MSKTKTSENHMVFVKCLLLKHKLKPDDFRQWHSVSSNTQLPLLKEYILFFCFFFHFLSCCILSCASFYCVTSRFDVCNVCFAVIFMQQISKTIRNMKRYCIFVSSTSVWMNVKQRSRRRRHKEVIHESALSTELGCVCLWVFMDFSARTT